ncbi:STAS domain-containing protein [Luteolibacter sp. LG18]|uniref:STAS domain-containing protein n=1 Tax=Luteolibacter sp. LG18 TaxID=2819286 RepID=UPI002B304B2E|nr:anti-sigma factor antagonist [Luteolibacter sp. LG18]
MSFELERDGNLVLRIKESALDRALAPGFRTFAAGALVEDDQRVVIDCSAVEFIDSSGVGALLHVNNLLPEEKRPVILRGITPAVLTVLELVRVHRFFEIEPLT